MRFIKKSQRKHPKVSLILLDWSVRESFHILHYLDQQTANRDDFEVVIIEYFSRIGEPIKKFEQHVDTWIVMDMPESCYYHKHLMYNVGIVNAHGEIAVICDSDAMVKPDFIETIINTFAENDDIVLHIDQFRNMRKDLYPFCYPDFDTVTGDGCINHHDGKTTGVLDNVDPIHKRNYGACMCAKRSDLIAIGGADEHIDFLGHICGPYDLTFRLVNAGKREIWHDSVFMYHTWHPSQAGGDDNYLGPHDGRHMSTTSLEALLTYRISPYAENEAIKLLRTATEADEETLNRLLIQDNYFKLFTLSYVAGKSRNQLTQNQATYIMNYRGYRITHNNNAFVAELAFKNAACELTTLSAPSLHKLKKQIHRKTPMKITLIAALNRSAMLLWHGKNLFLKPLARWASKRGKNLIKRILNRDKNLIRFIKNRYKSTIHFFRNFHTLPSRLVQLFKKSKAQLKSAKQQSETLSCYLTNMLAAINLLESENGRYIVLVHNKRQLLIVESLKKLRLIPKTTIKLATDFTSITNAIDAAISDNNRVIIGSELYLNNYSLIANKYSRDIIYIA